MTAPPERYSHPQPYTADEVLSWPEDGIRHEVIDGSLIVSPHANVRHQVLIQRLNRALDRVLPQGWEILTPANLRLAPGGSLVVPDVIVVSDADLDAVAVDPADVRLVIEVVSPGNRRTDRLIKPGLYAEAGIEHFWLFDDLPSEAGPSVRIFRLPPGATAYSFAAEQTVTVTVTEPFPVTIDLPGLLRVTADRAVISRVHELIALYGQRLRFTLRYAVTHDTSAPDEHLTGELIGVAQRYRGGADWGGKQWDVVVRTEHGDGHLLRTFAVSRIRSFAPADPTTQAASPRQLGA